MSIVLPTVIDPEKTWFYKDNEEILKDYIGVPYISYSSINAWKNPKYRPDFIKQKFAGIEIDSGIYADFGSYVGEGVENGKLDESESRFKGEENFNLIPRPDNAEFEKFVLIDFKDFIFIGFIDVYYEVEEGSVIFDLKTGGKGKESEYSSDEYLQVPLYAKALEDLGHKIHDTFVWFVRREGSHVSPPLKISDEQFKIKVKYNKTKVKKALATVKRTVKEISEAYKVYLKAFEESK